MIGGRVERSASAGSAAGRKREKRDRFCIAYIGDMVAARGAGKSFSPARCLMVQGTASHVGKSALVAALCRIFARDGWRVAPFKSWNMSLNSCVSAQGGEMARSQALQAQAAGVPPHTDMNPLLLKPASGGRVQVVLEGRAEGHFDASEYRGRVLDFLPHALAALERLRASYDIVIMEGAGSPAEVNLKEEDIANMRMARAAGAPVIIVGDIDRGGVFASLVGTLELLEPWEREMVRGLVINKFRGEIEFLGEGLRWLEERTGKTVLGVVPYLAGLALEEEDSVALEAAARRAPGDGGGHGSLDIAVIRLPYISNTTDFQPLEAEPGVGVRYVSRASALGVPDAVILPGSKDTMSDLSFLEESGLAAAVARLASWRVPVVGICGGYQILGSSIHDPYGVEGNTPHRMGLGLLPVRTVMARDKSTHLVKAVARKEVPWLGLSPSRPPLSGYEIHMGRSLVDGESPLLIVERGGTATAVEEGAVHGELPVFGCYLHGLFENRYLREAFLGFLRARRGLQAQGSPQEWSQQRERQLDLLADAVYGALDMDFIYSSLLGIRGGRTPC